MSARTMVPAWVRVVTVAAVLVVAGVAAVVSYAHMRALGLRAGEGRLADALPLSVDGLLVAASLVLYVRRRAGRPAGVLPWVGLLLGVSASVAANIAAAEPTLLGRVVAAWPPLAFALAFELLILVLRDSTAQTHTGGAERAVEALGEDGEGGDTRDEQGLSRFWADAPPAGAVPVDDEWDERDDQPGAGGEDRAAELIAAGAGRRRLARELGVSEYEARALLAASRNGDGGAR
ncbi:MAG: DUF2637 domain-containing protein [Pseudonocardia sp.]